MKPSKSLQVFKRMIKDTGASISAQSPVQGLRLMFDFYRDHRAEGCVVEEDGDMLLFQWGTYRWDDDRTFQLDVTRQFTEALPEDADDDQVMSQLSLTFHFAPPSELGTLSGDHWCRTPEDLADFETFVANSEAFRSTASLKPIRVTLQYGEV